MLKGCALEGIMLVQLAQLPSSAPVLPNHQLVSPGRRAGGAGGAGRAPDQRRGAAGAQEHRGQVEQARGLLLRHPEAVMRACCVRRACFQARGLLRHAGPTSVTPMDALSTCTKALHSTAVSSVTITLPAHHWAASP